MSERHDILIIGGGFSGMAAAIGLRERGHHDLVILEREDELGGTWYVNRYPGAQVDVPSVLYSFSFHAFDWSRRFARREEILAYTREVIDHYGLKEVARTGHDVQDIRWDAERTLWTVTTSRGVFEAPLVVHATGVLSQPHIPDVPGADVFAGRTMHTAQWPDDFDPTGKRIAVMGTGASGIQVIPGLAGTAKHVYALQRTPHYVRPRGDAERSPFMRRLLRWAPVRRLARWITYWGHESRLIAFKYSPRLMTAIAGREAARNRAVVEDEALLEALTPDFQIGCKRILLSDEYYPCYNRDDVTLVPNTFERLTEHGFRTTDGRQHAIDALVHATGFKAIRSGAEYVPYDITGTDGRTLAEAWGDAPHAYLSATVPGFPNMFFMGGPNAGIGHTSAIYMIEAGLPYLFEMVDAFVREGWERVEVRPDVEERFNEWLREEFATSVWRPELCRSWYQSKDGTNSLIWPTFTFTFKRMCHFRPADHLIA